MSSVEFTLDAERWMRFALTEAEVAADLAQRPDRSLAVAAEGEVGADVEESHPQLLAEEGGEVVSGELGELRGEGEDANAIRAQAAQ